MFSKIFKEFMTIYGVSPEEIARKIDRHPSRVRHWMNDSKPGKKVRNTLIDTIIEITESGNEQLWQQFMKQDNVKLILKQLQEPQAVSANQRASIIRALFENACSNKGILDYRWLIAEFKADYDNERFSEVVERIENFLSDKALQIYPDHLFEIYVILIRGYTMVGFAKRDTQYSKKALDIADKAQALYASPSRNILFQVERLRGMVYAVGSNWYDHYNNMYKAKDYFERTIPYYDDTCSKDDYIRLLNNLVGIHFQLCKFEYPTSNLEKANRFYTMAKDQIDKDTPVDVLQLVYSNGLRVYSTLACLKDTIHYYEETEKLYKEVLSVKALSLRSDFLATIFSAMADVSCYLGGATGDDTMLQRGLAFYKKAESCYDPSRQDLYIQLIEINRVNLMIYRMRPDNCEASYEQGMEKIITSRQYFDAIGMKNFPNLEKYALSLQIHYLLLSQKDNTELFNEVKNNLAGKLTQNDNQLDYVDFLFLEILLSYIENRDRDLSQVYHGCEQMLSKINTNEFSGMMGQLHVFMSLISHQLSLSGGEIQWNIESEIHGEAAKAFLEESVYKGMRQYYCQLLAITNEEYIGIRNAQNRT